MPSFTLLKKNFQKENPGQGQVQVPAAVVSQPIPPPQPISTPIPILSAVQSQQERRAYPPANPEKEPPVKKQRVQPPGPVVNSTPTGPVQSLTRGMQLPMAKLKAICGDVLKNLQQHAHGWVFNSPVNPVELGLLDYFEVVKRPMDLGTIKKRMENGCCNSLEAFYADVNLTFENAMLYNPEARNYRSMYLSIINHELLRHFYLYKVRKYV